ncbi:MAG: hypothetical protein ACRDSK_14835 [Actinophytocola sp.]|uniref:hypothetical protein n=1 Tax=Actinophytocola sp. TaxID=1872138 RepID=UPI003D6BEE6D
MTTQTPVGTPAEEAELPVPAPPEQQPEPDGAGAGGGGGTSDQADDGVSMAWIVVATIVSSLVIVAGHAFLYWAFAHNWDRTDTEVPIVWQPVVGGTLGFVALFSFGMYYGAARRARVAITASFLMTFLAALTFVLTVPAFADTALQQDTTGLFNDFRYLVTVIVLAYFGTEGVITTTKVISTARANRAASPNETTVAIRRADVDLPPRRR